MDNTLNNLLASLGSRPDGVSDQAVITDLLQKDMISGLGRDANGRLSFSTPGAGTGVEAGSSGAAGYAGPLRPSDVPDWKATADIPVIYGGKGGMHISPGTEMGRMQAGGPFRGILPDAQAQQLAQGLEGAGANLPPGSSAAITKGILEKLGIGEDDFQKAFKVGLGHAMGTNAGGGGTLNTKLQTPLGQNAKSYVNMDTGERATPDMTLGDVSQKGTKFKALSAGQEKQIEALNNLKTHIQLTEQYLNALPDSTSLLTGGRKGNSLSMWIQSQANNPDAVALSEQLQAMTPISTARAFLGSGGRAGPAAAKMLHESNVTTGDDKVTAAKKLANLKFVVTDLARENGLPVKPYEDAFKSGLQGGALPKGIPAGSTLTEHKSGGKPVYKAPDGSFHVEGE